MSTETNQSLQKLCYVLFALFILAAFLQTCQAPAHASTAPDQTETLLKQTRARAYEEGFRAGQIDGLEAARQALKDELHGSCSLMRTDEGNTWEIALVSAKLTNTLAVCESLKHDKESCVCHF
jgi:hypothetical protein